MEEDVVVAACPCVGTLRSTWRQGLLVLLSFPRPWRSPTGPDQTIEQRGKRWNQRLNEGGGLDPGNRELTMPWPSIEVTGGRPLLPHTRPQPAQQHHHHQIPHHCPSFIKLPANCISRSRINKWSCKVNILGHRSRGVVEEIM